MPPRPGLPLGTGAALPEARPHPSHLARLPRRAPPGPRPPGPARPGGGRARPRRPRPLRPATRCSGGLVRCPAPLESGARRRSSPVPGAARVRRAGAHTGPASRRRAPGPPTSPGTDPVSVRRPASRSGARSQPRRSRTGVPGPGKSPGRWCSPAGPRCGGRSGRRSSGTSGGPWPRGGASWPRGRRRGRGGWPARSAPAATGRCAGAPPTHRRVELSGVLGRRQRAALAPTRRDGCAAAEDPGAPGADAVGRGAEPPRRPDHRLALREHQHGLRPPAHPRVGVGLTRRRSSSTRSASPAMARPPERPLVQDLCQRG